MAGVGPGEREAGLAVGAARVLGLDRVVLEPLSPGSSRGAARVVGEDGSPLAFLRYDLGVESTVTLGKSLAGEIGIVSRAHGLGFPVPRVFGMIEDPQAAVMELVEGTARPDADEAERVGAEFMGHIARLHRIAPAEFGVSAAPTLRDAVAADLAGYELDARRHGLMDEPLIRLAFAVLRETLTPSEEPPAMLHGDVGAGNFMVHEGRVSAILDWELAHAGDMHEDIAWLWVRGAHTPFGDPAVRVAEYQAAGGRELDPRRLAWNVALVTLKSVIGLGRRLRAPGEDTGLLTIEIAAVAYELLLCVALGSLVGVDVTALEEEPVARRSPEARLVELWRVLEPPATREGVVLARYLETSAAQRDWRDRRLAEDCASRLGIRPDQLRARLDAEGGADLAAVVAVLGAAAWRRCKALPNAGRRVRRALDIGFARVGEGKRNT